MPDEPRVNLAAPRTVEISPAISTYLVYDNLAQCFGTDPCPGQDSSSITGRLRAASAQGEWENLPSRNGNGPYCYLKKTRI